MGPPLHRLRIWARAALPWRVLAPVGAALGLLWSFVELAEEISEGETRGFDEAVVLALRTEDPADPVGPVWLEEMARDITALGGHTFIGLLVLCVSIYLALHQRYRMAAFVAMSIGAGYALSHLLKLGFDRPRPELVPHGQQVYTSSFPSGHSMAAALAFLTLAALLSRIEERPTQVFLLGTALGMTALVGISRVYLGVHWPTDVLGGCAMGTFWAILAWMLADQLDRRGLL